VEALMRWRDPMRGVLDAHELVPAAIEHGVIAGLGARVRNDALHAVSDWLHADRSRYLSVNLSGPELESDSLSTDLLTLVDSGGVSPAQLALEVREATYRDAAGGRARVLEDVRAAGFPVVIDGYGEGFSSYDQLERVPVDAIKLSGRLTEGIGRSPASERAITAILAFMRFFGLPVIGTDIETSAQLAFFAAHGCTLGQGYLLGPPVPADELDDARATIAAGELATDWLPPIHV
jgi:EAL domain-containing protein (putative c-di-GMP-specific phosphodiesterase class I)